MKGCFVILKVPWKNWRLQYCLDFSVPEISNKNKDV